MLRASIASKDDIKIGRFRTHSPIKRRCRVTARRSQMYRTFRASRNEEVPADSIDRLCAETHIDEIGVLKVVIERAELGSFAAARRLPATKGRADLQQSPVSPDDDPETYNCEIAG